MSQLVLANLCAGLDLVALIAYAVLGGADFGAGVWDLLARGPTADRQRAAVAHAIGPVWEANNVWLIFVLVVTWTAFPIVYAGLSEALFIPLTLVLVGIVFRGSAYAFRWQYGGQGRFWGLWGRAFSVASTVTPFMLGAAAGAIAGGDIHVHNGVAVANYWTTWLTPFALSCGAFAVGLCSVLAATYLTVEALNSGDTTLREVFRQRAIVSGAVTALIGAIAALLARSESPVLWSGLIGSALPLSLGAVLIGLATATISARPSTGSRGCWWLARQRASCWRGRSRSIPTSSSRMLRCKTRQPRWHRSPRCSSLRRLAWSFCCPRSGISSASSRARIPRSRPPASPSSSRASARRTLAKPLEPVGEACKAARR